MQNGKRRLLLVTLTLLAATLSGCATGTTEYVQGSSQVIAMQPGDVAAEEGFWLSPAAYVDLAACCDMCLTAMEEKQE